MSFNLDFKVDNNGINHAVIDKILTLCVPIKMLHINVECLKDFYDRILSTK